MIEKSSYAAGGLLCLAIQKRRSRKSGLTSHNRTSGPA
jgi:hypothetical protein